MMRHYSSQIFYIKRYRLLYLSILIISLAYFVRVFYYFDNPIQWRDSYFYKEIVETWEDKKEYPSKDRYGQENIIPPFPLYIFMLMHKMTGKSIFLSNVALQIVLGSISILFLWLILNEIRIGIIPSILISLIGAFHKSLLDFSTQITRDNLYVFFCSLLIFFFIKYLKRKSLFYSFVLGILISLICLVRYEGAEFLLILPIILFFQKKISIKRKLISILLIYSAFCITFLEISQITTPHRSVLKAIHIKFRSYYNDII